MSDRRTNVAEQVQSGGWRPVGQLPRREFITFLGGAAATWPLAARAQQGDRVRRIGWLMPGDENDPAVKLQVSAFTQALAALGWTDGRNVRMERSAFSLTTRTAAPFPSCWRMVSRLSCSIS